MNSLEDEIKERRDDFWIEMRDIKRERESLLPRNKPPRPPM
jgi:hypothetical protein